MRLHRAGRFELSPTASFTLLDEYTRAIIPGLRVTYHPTDWLGFGLWGGYGFQTGSNLADELQKVGIDDRRCAENSASKACRLTVENLTRPGTNKDGSIRTGKLADDQLGAMTWFLAPEVTAVPFRGKLALFASVFPDADIAFFAGPAFVGLRERKPCGLGDDGSVLDKCSDSFSLIDRVAITGTFGLRLNFYINDFVGFGGEFRALPFNWNTAGFDNHGGGPGKAFPDHSVNGADSEFKFNSMASVYATIALPTAIKTTE
ncbi:MAG: hypothetical protein U0441_30400 [Polyangiaceae bacterium]